jgi:hypothetical protein
MPQTDLQLGDVVNVINVFSSEESFKEDIEITSIILSGRLFP